MASKTNKESVQLSLKIDGKDAVNVIKELDTKASALVKEMHALEDAGQQATEAYRKLDIQRKELLKQSNTAYEASKRAAEQQARLSVNEGKSLKALQGEYRKLQAILSNLPPTHKDFNANVELLAKKKGKIDEIKKSFGGIKQEVEGANKSTGGFLSSLSTGFLAVMAVIGVALNKVKDFAAETLRLYDVQAKADAQLQAVINSTGAAAGRNLEQLKAQASELQKITLFGDEQTQAAQALLLSFTEIKAEVFDETVPLVQDLATAMATATGETVDLKSASIQLGKALNDPIKGVSKLAEVGVTFNEQQKAQIKTMVEAGNTADAQRVILAELRKEFGGSAEAAAKAGLGAFQQFQNRISDVKEGIGQLINEQLVKLEPIIEIIVSGIEDFIRATTTGEETTTKLGKAISIVADVVKGYIKVMDTIYSSIARFIIFVADKSIPVLAFFTEKLATVYNVSVDLSNKLRELAGLKPLDIKFDVEKFKKGADNIKKLLDDALKPRNTVPDGPPAPGEIKGKVNPEPAGDGAGDANKEKKRKAAEDLRLKELQSFFERENLLIAGAVLKQDITEAEALQRRLDNQRSYYQAQLGLMAQFGQEGSNKYIEVQNQLLGVELEADKQALLLKETLTVEGIQSLSIKVLDTKKLEADALLEVQRLSQESSEQSQKDYLARKAANEKAYADSRAALEKGIVDVAKDGLDTVIGFLGQDEAARKKNAKALKAFAIGNVWVDYFQEVQAIWRAAQANPSNILFPGSGNIIAAFKIAFSTARAQQATSKIASQKYAKGGIAQGADHSTGGIKLFDTASQKVVGEMQGGEPILSRETYANNRPIIDRLLFSSMYRGGAPVFATGGFAPGAAAIASQASIAQTNQRSEEMQAAMLTEAMRTRQAIEAIPTTLRADVSLRNIQDADQTLGDIRKASSL